MTTGRPLSNLTVAGLRARLHDSPDDRALLEEVHHELTFRSTGRAQRLEREVAALLAEPQAGGRTRKMRSRTAGKPSSAEKPRPANPLHGSGLESRYAALRATFTAEAEILARWGMTSLAPPRLREVVFQFWDDELVRPGVFHPLGLDHEDLHRDIVALKNERREESGDERGG